VLPPCRTNEPNDQSERRTASPSKGHDLPPAAAQVKDGSYSMPKGAMRILMGAKMRSDFQERKKQMQGQDANRIGDVAQPSRDVKGKGKATEHTATSKAQTGKAELKLLPGETLGNFNRRVEKTMASSISATVRAANSTSKKKSKRKRADEDDRIAADEAQKERSAVKAAERKAAEPSSKDLKRAREAITQPSASSSSTSSHHGEEKDWAPVNQRRRLNDVADAPPRFTRLPKA